MASRARCWVVAPLEIPLTNLVALAYTPYPTLCYNAPYHSSFGAASWRVCGENRTLRATLPGCELSGAYETPYGGKGELPEGAKFLCIHVPAEYFGGRATRALEPFSLLILYRGEQDDTQFNIVDRLDHEPFKDEEFFFCIVKG